MGYLIPDRSVIGVDAYGDGVGGGQVDGSPYDTRVDLQGRTNTGSIFATDTITLGHTWSITASGRYNRTAVENRDLIRPNASVGSLSSDQVFERLNPSAGLTFSPTRTVNAYFSYSEGSRAPTSIELGCADPKQPCKLPNAMAGDPPLLQVVTRTLEAGLRGRSENLFRWSAGWFRAENRNDILFVASGQTGFGYFKNFGETRRQGLELDSNIRFGRVNAGIGYTFLDATFESPELVNGSSNASNSNAQSGIKGLDSVIEVKPGNRIPLIPRQMVKVFADVQVTSKILVTVGAVGFSSSYARGNENNQHAPDGAYYLGEGNSPGYAMVNLGARYRVQRHIELFGQINNLFDRKYYNAAQLGPLAFTNQGNFVARPLEAVTGEFPLRHGTFYAPGTPIGAWCGIRLRF